MTKVAHDHKDDDDTLIRGDLLVNPFLAFSLLVNPFLAFSFPLSHPVNERGIRWISLPELTQEE